MASAAFTGQNRDDLTIYYKDGGTAKNSRNMVKFTPLHRALLQRDHRQGAGLTRELHCPS